VLNKGTTGTIF